MKNQKTAAQVGTDTASIYAIAPEQLMHIIDEGTWYGNGSFMGWQKKK